MSEAYGTENLVSGTKAEVLGSVSGRLNKAGTNPPYDEAVAYSGAIEIGGEAIPVKIFEPSLSRGAEEEGNRGGSTQPNWMPRSLPVRFASTHFADGASIPVTFTVVWKFFKGLQEVATTTTSATVNVKAHNKVLAWKFTRDNLGVTLQEPYLTIRDAVMAAGMTAYSTAHYTEETLALGQHLINKDQIADHLGKVTSLFSDTHGSATGAQDSGVSPGSNGQFAYWTAVDSVPRPLWNGTSHPLGLALAVVYGCKTLPSQGSAMPLIIRVSTEV